MLHIGLTGNIASGKSLAAAELARLGATIIDSDLLAREAVEPGSPGLAAVMTRFGRGVIAPDGTLDRAALRRLVFADPALRAALNDIVHPEVRRLRNARLAAARVRGDRVVVSDVPLLFEVGLEAEFDGILFVDAPDAVRLERLVRHRGLTEADARAMMAAQWPSEKKRAGATWVIDNDGSPEQLAAQIAGLWRTLSTQSEGEAHGPVTP